MYIDKFVKNKTIKILYINSNKTIYVKEIIMKKKILSVLGIVIIASSIFSVKPVYAKTYSMSLAPYSRWRGVDAPDCKDYKLLKWCDEGQVSLNRINDKDSYTVDACISDNPYQLRPMAGQVRLAQGQEKNYKEYDAMVVGETYFLMLKNLNYKKDYVVATGTFNIQ